MIKQYNILEILRCLSDESNVDVKDLIKGVKKDDLIEIDGYEVTYCNCSKLKFYDHNYEISWSFTNNGKYDTGTISFTFGSPKNSNRTIKLLEKFQEEINEDLMASIPNKGCYVSLTFDTVQKDIDPIKFIKECFTKIKYKDVQSTFKEFLESLNREEI